MQWYSEAGLYVSPNSRSASHKFTGYLYHSKEEATLMSAVIMPKVYNKRDKNVPAGAINIGRPSKWGNRAYIGPDGTREEVVKKYEIYLDEEIAAGRLDLEELRGKDLWCWCAPLPCHGDILLERANK